VKYIEIQAITLQQLEKIANALYKHSNNLLRVLLLNGEVGVGKTTFTHFYLNNSLTKIPFSSPTYNFVNVYDDILPNIYHFDLYRATSDDYEWIFEYFENSDAISIVEWSELHPELFTEISTISLEMFYTIDNEKRVVRIKATEKKLVLLGKVFEDENIVFEKCDGTTDN